MLSFFDMSKKSDNERLEMYGAYAIMFAALAPLVLAIGSLLSGIFGTDLVAGPRYVVGSPTADGSPAIVEHTPISLDDTLLRLGWNSASALMLAAIALLLFTFGQTKRRIAKQPLFSSEARSFLSGRWYIAASIFIVGGLLRFFLRSPIADAAGITDIGLHPDDDFGAFVFDVPMWALAIVSLIAGFVLHEGGDVFAETEDIV